MPDDEEDEEDEEDKTAESYEDEDEDEEDDQEKPAESYEDDQEEDEDDDEKRNDVAKKSSQDSSIKNVYESLLNKLRFNSLVHSVSYFLGTKQTPSTEQLKSRSPVIASVSVDCSQEGYVNVLRKVTKISLFLASISLCVLILLTVLRLCLVNGNSLRQRGRASALSLISHHNHKAEGYQKLLPDVESLDKV